MNELNKMDIQRNSKDLFDGQWQYCCEMINLILLRYIVYLQRMECFVNGQDNRATNSALIKKIQYLQNQKTLIEVMVRDLEEILRINKQTLKIMLPYSENTIIELLNKQNQVILKKLYLSYEQNRRLNSVVLFESQIRIQERDFFKQRITEFQNIVSNLRKYLIDKEDSFCQAANRLRKYEDINQLTMKGKLINLKEELQKNITQNILSTLSKERNIYKKLYQDLREVSNNQKKPYQGLQEDTNNQKKNYNFLKEDNTSKETALTEKIIFEEGFNPNKELIRLLKKQKINSQILEEALNDSLQKNQELICYNKQITKAYQQLQQKCQYLQAQVVKAQTKIGQYQQNYFRRVKNRSKCDIDKPAYNYNFLTYQQKQRHNILQKLKRDMQKISYLMIYHTKRQVKSYSEGVRENQQVMCQSQQEIEINNL